MADHSIIFSGMTHQGFVRDRNEDSYIMDAPEGMWPLLFAIADGLGGHKNGALASRTAISYAVSFLREQLPAVNDPEKVKSILADTLQKTNIKVYTTSLEDPDNTGMGTTLTLMALYEQSCYVAHIGDSRCYMFRERELEQLTRDDTYVSQMVASGSLEESEVVSHPRRHVLTQALGYPEYVEPQITHVDLRPKDRYLLSSDGLHGILNRKAIARTMRHAGSPDEAASSLIEQTLQAGAPDNVTVIVVFA
ncbi:MAG TPA: Stp1/IreP family PP2C-type Ser/Thr phosphatase [Bacillota bacterium]|jgi:serine/threonine protein phosphatase PrpC|nr:Stp1/IreP family PP2C-type Ser/Thr phosphatase [Fastidiosipila sp.]HPX93816.1 Stp1/IreP family PP2C-type Ser/Thr phosphatase [Bacillota bacterium]HQB81641.1 Stp1/IreP family PP2C-type Ser/Thr phosphatase [Bacillota bacterium]